MVAMAAVLNREGAQDAGNLARVSAIAVPNLMPKPEFVVDARVERAAAANAAATATAIAATEVALSVQATVEASATAAAETQQAAARATAAAEATATAHANATEVATTLSAKREAQVRAAEVTATRNADALAAAVVANDPKLPGRMSSLLIALTPLLGGILGLRLWRIKKEPFVLKAKPERPS